MFGLLPQGVMTHDSVTVNLSSLQYFGTKIGCAGFFIPAKFAYQKFFFKKSPWCGYRCAAL